ncbi:DUF6624 domain-containing protein [Pseudomonas aeruginosa]|jgi:hypothetical protein|uniref:DUF6624 domain-containing protein n=1 Tax=Pseudomonas aeruginosa TaxID=287 RepID=UPI001D0B599E|nr:DUF6624 domain-containing protein [Pseudomonas aeruginosa]MCC0128309.1 hypothetical protein [Pseudomonas aeruginosa]MCC0152451.1 hypothetical protein [Pseudomonas aeruginosa]MCC0159020.1 hypothetical protein [Pseudomonas aeruginosa]MCC0171772.1 hypothetical protein [Pseudomonas aeruginosa]MCC0198106.1 hypothetical protein [Pseudomonas aeruginosa]
MTRMLSTVRKQLLALRARDEQVRAELTADGSLYEGYHPRMEKVHQGNAEELRSIIQEHGWPDEELAGPEGAEAAWLIAQHSIGEPEFLRQCRTLLDEASSLGRVPRWQFAYIDDRIRVFEGKPQRFGTQIDLRPEGPKIHELEDPSQVDAWRKEIGLPALASTLARAQSDPLPTPDEYEAKEAAGLSWRRKVGWVK